jgi:NADH-quinone oxidoreductase subunit E
MDSPDQIEATIRDILGKWDKEKSNLVPLLQQTQSKIGYLPQTALMEIARYLGMAPVEVYGVATFYNQFRLNPPGKHSIKVCLGTACHMAGGQLVLEAMARELDIKIGGVTPDGEFDLERVACIGCCALAPVLTVAGEAYARMSPTRVEELLVTLKPASDEKGAGI